MEVLYHIKPYKAIGCRDIPLHSPRKKPSGSPTWAVLGQVAAAVADGQQPGDGTPKSGFVVD